MSEICQCPPQGRFEYAIAGDVVRCGLCQLPVAPANATLQPITISHGGAKRPANQRFRVIKGGKED